MVKDISGEDRGVGGVRVLSGSREVRTQSEDATSDSRPRE